MEELASTPCTPAGVVADAGALLADLDGLLWAARPLADPRGPDGLSPASAPSS